MHQDATWYGGRLQPTRLCVRSGPSYPQKKAHPPHLIFGPCLLWPNGWMDEDATWYGSRPRPSHFVLDGFPAIRERGTAARPSFRPMSIVASGHGRPSQLLLSSCYHLTLVDVVTYQRPAGPLSELLNKLK